MSCGHHLRVRATAARRAGHGLRPADRAILEDGTSRHPMASVCRSADAGRLRRRRSRIRRSSVRVARTRLVCRLVRSTATALPSTRSTTMGSSRHLARPLGGHRTTRTSLAASRATFELTEPRISRWRRFKLRLPTIARSASRAASTSALAGSPRTWSVSTDSPRSLSSARASSRSWRRRRASTGSRLAGIVTPLRGVRFDDRHDDDVSPIVGERGGALKRALGRLGPVVADNDSPPVGAIPNRGVDFGASGSRVDVKSGVKHQPTVCPAAVVCAMGCSVHFHAAAAAARRCRRCTYRPVFTALPSTPAPS